MREVVTPVTTPINIGPSPPLRACKIGSCYGLENHKTLGNIDLLRLLRPLRQKTWVRGRKVLLRYLVTPQARGPVVRLSYSLVVWWSRGPWSHGPRLTARWSVVWWSGGPSS